MNKSEMVSRVVLAWSLALNVGACAKLRREIQHPKIHLNGSHTVTDDVPLYATKTSDTIVSFSPVKIVYDEDFNDLKDNQIRELSIIEMQEMQKGAFNIEIYMSDGTFIGKCAGGYFEGNRIITATHCVTERYKDQIIVVKSLMDGTSYRATIQNEAKGFDLTMLHIDNEENLDEKYSGSQSVLSMGDVPLGSPLYVMGIDGRMISGIYMGGNHAYANMTYVDDELTAQTTADNSIEIYFPPGKEQFKKGDSGSFIYYIDGSGTMHLVAFNINIGDFKEISDVYSIAIRSDVATFALTQSDTS